ncbi:MAG: hypothetical protein IT299_11765 [Dehalococcoidia bacterium]|nr:hypothetical protein [Dehalococcoidia bacterium]
MQVVVAVAVTWVGLMSLIVARARRHRRPGESSGASGTSEPSPAASPEVQRS